MFSHIQFSVTLWTVAHQAPLSVGFSRQEYWSGLPFPIPGDLPDAAIEPMSPESPALAGRFFIIVPPGKPLSMSPGEGKDNSTLSFSFVGRGDHFIRAQRIYLTMQETEEVWVQSLSQEDPLEEEIATHSSILA